MLGGCITLGSTDDGTGQLALSSLGILTDEFAWHLKFTYNILADGEGEGK